MFFKPASRCLFCNLSGKYRIANICPVCCDNLARLGHVCHLCALPLTPGQKICGRCQLRPSSLDRVVAACPYDKGMDVLIRRFKDRADFAALELMVSLMEQRIEQEEVPAPDCVVPIPLHPLKRLWRGYNQTQLLAAVLGKRLGLEIRLGALRRTWTPDQRMLRLAERRRRPSGARPGVHAACP